MIRSYPRSRKARSKRALTVTSTCPAKPMNRRTACSGSRRAAQRRSPAGSRSARRSAPAAAARIDQRLERLPARGGRRVARRSHRCATRCRSSAVSRPKTTKVASSSGTSVSPAALRTDRVAAAPGQARVTRDDVLEERPGDRRRRAAQARTASGCVVGGQRPAAGLDQLDEAVGGVERELHALQPSEHMFGDKATGSVLASGPRSDAGGAGAARVRRVITRADHPRPLPVHGEHVRRMGDRPGGRDAR